MANGYLALIRGVNNIGMAYRVSMADLRALFEGLGFGNVRTVLNSGNVIFSATGCRREELTRRIEGQLASELNLVRAVAVLSAREVAEAVRGNPLSGLADNPSRLLVMVPPSRAALRLLNPLLEERWDPERLALGRRVAYLWCADGVARSPLWDAVDRGLGRSGTVRNMATFTRALDLIEGLAP